MNLTQADGADRPDLTRRGWLQACAGAASGLLPALHASAENGPVSPTDLLSAELRERMAQAALALARKNVRGGPGDPAYPRPFVDAAFSSNIFYWDTCIIACYAKHHQDELPIANALDNFHARIDDDGHIGREYLADGRPMWPKEHPVSVNPPLLAMAELELFETRPDLQRLARVYPLLRRHLAYLHRRYGMPDGLYFSDAFGSGMDNIPRFPDGWRDDGQGIALRQLHPELFVYDGLAPRWNRQGRSVDFSAQVALFAEHLMTMARLLGDDDAIGPLAKLRQGIVDAINAHCWHPGIGCYFDLGYGRQIPRQHIGMFWPLMAGVASPAQAEQLVRHLTNPAKFWRKVPVASYPADQPGFAPGGEYWLGSVWAPTNLMVVRGLARYGFHDVARELVRRYQQAVASVFLRDGTFYENYAPDAWAPGSQARADFCGWTAVLPLALAPQWLA